MNPSSELVVLKSRAGPISAIIGTVIVVVFVWLAVRNLLHGIAVIASTLWLLLIALVIIINVRDSGWRAFPVAVAGAFSRQQVLIVDSDSSVLEIGFRLSGLTIIEHRIRAEDLVGIRWNTGQASDLAGRDVNDWSVFLWYRDPAKALMQNVRRPGQWPLVIGSPRAKSTTEALARRVIGFLNESGISVVVEQSL